MIEDYYFLLKPLIAILVLSFIYSILGIFVILKKLSFFSDGIAHASIFFLALAYFLNLDLVVLGIVGAIFLSSLIFFLERKTKLHTDALIGLIFVSFLSLGIILMSFKRGYQPELLNFFIGNILTLSSYDFYLILFFSFLILLLLIIFFRIFMLVFLDRTEAILRGFNVNLYEFIFYLILGTATILGIKITGIVLITALLILPPISASFISRNFKELLIFSPFLGCLNVVSGFFLSFVFNLPLSASIVVFSSFIFFLFFLFNLLKAK